MCLPAFPRNLSQGRDLISVGGWIDRLIWLDWIIVDSVRLDTTRQDNDKKRKDKIAR